MSDLLRLWQPPEDFIEEDWEELVEDEGGREIVLEPRKTYYLVDGDEIETTVYVVASE